MFVFSVKAGKKQVVSAVVGIGAAALIALVALLIPAPAKSSSTDVPVVSTHVKTGEERISFLKHLGYEADEDSAEVREIRLPDETDETLVKYNELQKKTGFDLMAYLGKRVKLYTYRVLNQDTQATAHLYVYRDTVIAGHIATADGDKPLA